jgi:predicted N-acyltransferase
MTEPDTLDRNIEALKELQRVAWRQLADPSVTPVARRELLDQIRQSGADLRHCLEMTSERARFRARAMADGFGKFKLRLLG